MRIDAHRRFRFGALGCSLMFWLVCWAGAYQVVVTNEYGLCSLVGGDVGVFRKHSVTANHAAAVAVRGGDVNDDGAMDIISAAKDGNLVAWWENRGGSGTNWVSHTVDAAANTPYGIDVADVDGNGSLDVLAALWGQQSLAWWENVGGGTNWVKHTVTTGLSGAADVLAGDINGDGRLDIAGIGLLANQVAWWENTDGAGTNWILHVVDGTISGPNDIQLADVDSDGDADLVGAADDLLSSNDRIVWWESVGGTGTNWVRHVIDGSFDRAHAVDAADFDRDGDIDVLGSTIAVNGSAPDITWWENTDGLGTSWRAHTVGDGYFSQVYDVEATDLDRDGDVDILGAARDDDNIAWWENRDGRGLLWQERLVESSFRGARSVAVGDIDGDGEKDVIAAASEANAVAWWENDLEGRVLFYPPVDTNDVARTLAHCFITNTPIVNGGTQLVCVGWTGTGSVPAHGTLPSTGSFLLTNDTTIVWNWATQYLLRVSIQSNGWVDGPQGWQAAGTNVWLTAHPEYLHVFQGWTGDVPASNAMDNPLALAMDRARSVTAVFRAVDHRITASAGSNGAIAPSGVVGVVTGDDSTFEMHPDPHYRVLDVRVDGQSVGSSNAYTFVNVTNDRTIEATFALDTYALTVTNAVGICHFTTNRVISWVEHATMLDANGPLGIAAADFNGDGGMDILAPTSLTNGLFWWENLDAVGTAWIRHTVWTNGLVTTLARAGDLDLDTAPDLLAATSHALYWLRNVDAGATNWTVHTVVPTFPEGRDVVVSDMNGNAWRDIVAAYATNTIAWWENMDGTGGAWFAHTVVNDFQGVQRVLVHDVDGDRRADILATSSNLGTVAWWRNVVGDGTRWERYDVTTGFPGVVHLQVADFDADGDPDVCAHASGPERLAWWENTAVAGQHWRRHDIPLNAIALNDIQASDIDADGYPDIVATSPTADPVLWRENPEPGTVWTSHVINSGSHASRALLIADLNNDGRRDVAATLPGDGSISWCERRSADEFLFLPAVDATNILYQPQAYCFLTNSVRRNGKSQLKCIGWKGSGSVPSSGSGTSVGPFELAEDTAITWQWVTRHWVDIAEPTNGTYSVPGDWYRDGTTLVIQASADTGYLFAGWEGVAPAQEFANPLPLLVKQPETVGATFVAGDHLILAAAGTGGSIQPDGKIGVFAGNDQRFDFIANGGFVVSNIWVDGAWIGPGARYTFTSVESNHAIEVYFEPETASTDTDGDGLPNVDERVFGTDIFRPDTDADGVGDYEESIAGTSGTNAASFFTLSVHVAPDGNAVLEWQSATGRVYDLWWRPDLATGSWQLVADGTNFPGLGTPLRHTNTVANPNAFFRSRVRKAAP